MAILKRMDNAHGFLGYEDTPKGHGWREHVVGVELSSTVTEDGVLPFNDC
jgi:hypothetical protein